MEWDRTKQEEAQRDHASMVAKEAGSARGMDHISG